MMPSKVQKTILLIGLIVFLLMGIFPPWTKIYIAGNQSIAMPAGYCFLGNPQDIAYPLEQSYTSGRPYGLKLDGLRLAIQWVAVLIATGFGVLLTSGQKKKETIKVFSEQFSEDEKQDQQGIDAKEIEALMKQFEKEEIELGEETARKNMTAALLQYHIAKCEKGCDSDEIPEGYGEFGLEITNPIPVAGISASDIYLRRLRVADNKKVAWVRVGSVASENIAQPIDKYSITDIDSGEKLAILYISPYHKRISEKAPKGFILVEE